MTDTVLLGPKALSALLLDIVRRMPGNTNPRKGRSCRYTSPTDPDRHCLIGQLAAEQGWDLGMCPTITGLGAATMARQLSWPVTSRGAGYLREVQALADAFTPSGLTRTWSEVESYIVKRAA